ncbi:MAG: hypothetical protein M3O91_08880 [Chloroflexota bacterium]|nr:hypothetical protein [Chloroflexota bacterium]
MLGPVRRYSTVASTTTTGSKVMIAGDLKGSTIVDRLGMQVELVPHLFGATNRYPVGQRGLFAIYRTGSGSSHRTRCATSRSAKTTPAIPFGATRRGAVSRIARGTPRIRCLAHLATDVHGAAGVHLP